MRWGKLTAKEAEKTTLLAVCFASGLLPEPHPETPQQVAELLEHQRKRSVEEERERCARVAERACGRAGVNHDEPRCCQSIIAAAIRAGEESE